MILALRALVAPCTAPTAKRLHLFSRRFALHIAWKSLCIRGPAVTLRDARIFSTQNESDEPNESDA